MRFLPVLVILNNSSFVLSSPLVVVGWGVAPSKVGSESVRSVEFVPPWRLFGEDHSPNEIQRAGKLGSSFVSVQTRGNAMYWAAYSKQLLKIH